MSGRSHREEGMILVNVLMFVAIASGIVLLLINREELALDRAIRTREASRALAVVRGGELSVIAALRRDAEVAPEADYVTEPWGEVSESGVPITGGTFDLAVADAEGRFNANLVRGGDAANQILFTKIGHAAGLTDEQIVAAIVLIRERGPLTDLRPIRYAGIDPEVASRLEAMATALPGRTEVNLNAAPVELMAALFNDQAVAERLAALRARQGYLSQKDLTDQDVTMPAGASLRSNTFWVRTRATIGDTAQQGATLLQRRQEEEQVLVLPVARWRNAAIPPEAPKFPGAE